MKYLRQFCIILLVSALGEGLHILLPLPVPASVYGLVLMLGALASGILKLEQVEEAADFLVEICRLCSFLQVWAFWKRGVICSQSGFLLCS